MVESALLVVMLVFDLAGMNLELAENQILIQIPLEGLRVIRVVHNFFTQDIIGRKHREVIPRECQGLIVHLIILRQTIGY